MANYRTPGPWLYISGSVYSPDGLPLAHMDREPGNGTRPPERDANARLMAASPDLLRLAETIRDYLDAQPILEPEAEAIREHAAAILDGTFRTGPGAYGQLTED